MIDALRWATSVAFVGLAVAALREWRRRPIPAAAWMLATFVDVATILVTAGVLPDDPTAWWAVALERALFVALFAVPWLLYRFTTTFMPASRLVEWSATGLTLAIMAVSVALPDFPGEDEPDPSWWGAYLVGALAVWTYVSLLAGTRLWRAGRTEPRIPRRRMRLLGGAAILLAVVLLVSGAFGGSDVATLTTQGLALVIAGLFFLGYAPPLILRYWWRRPEEHRLREAELSLLAATTFDEVTKAMLPAVSAVVGARGAAFVTDDGAIAAAHGVLPVDVESIAVEDFTGGPIVTVPLRSGTLIVGTSPFSPIFGDEELALVHSFGVVADLAAERVRLLERERAARIELQESNSELDQFASVASHDLKEPLQVVSGFTELIETRYGDRLDETGHQYLSHITTALGRMQQIIDDLLRLARVGRDLGDLDVVDVVDVEALVHDSLANLATTLTATGGVVTVETLPPAHCDAGLVRQVFQNLLANALHYGGPTPEVVVSGRRDDTRCTYVVRDSGPGIAAKDQERIFRPFERAVGRDGPGGTGIGLSVVRRIVQLHGGEIWVESPDGQGASFCFTLPAAAT
ncbi:MAG TPA: ATP-binding protein [Acidimicrobiia bacterium]|nr:ATP-binding protein [Acidimicrobiia bacterium]